MSGPIHDSDNVQVQNIELRNLSIEIIQINRINIKLDLIFRKLYFHSNFQFSRYMIFSSLKSFMLLSLHLGCSTLGYFLRLFTFPETTLQDIVEFIRQQNQAFQTYLKFSARVISLTQLKIILDNYTMF